MPSTRRRLGQGVRALLAPLLPVDLDLPRQHLSDRELVAFQKMSRADQLHSLRVLRQVLDQQPITPPALAAAALLHDVGKSRYHLAAWQKTLAVLVEFVCPPLARTLASDQRLSFWRASFTVHKHHPQWGADILRSCGSDDTVIWLVERHQENADDLPDFEELENLRRLQTADSA